MAVGHAKYPTFQSLEYSYRHSRRFFLLFIVKLDGLVFPQPALDFPWLFIHLFALLLRTRGCAHWI